MSIHQQPDLVADPVAHISISGVHGGDELDHRLRHAEWQGPRDGSALTPLLVGAAIGAALAWLLKR